MAADQLVIADIILKSGYVFRGTFKKLDWKMTNGKIAGLVWDVVEPPVLNYIDLNEIAMIVSVHEK